MTRRKRSKHAAHGPGQRENPNNSRPVPPENGECPLILYHLENLVYHAQALDRLSAFEPVEEYEANYNRVQQELPPVLYFMDSQWLLAHIKREEEERELRRNRWFGWVILFLPIFPWSTETLACLLYFGFFAFAIAQSYLQASRTKTYPSHGGWVG